MLALELSVYNFQLFPEMMEHKIYKNLLQFKKKKLSCMKITYKCDRTSPENSQIS